MIQNPNSLSVDIIFEQMKLELKPSLLVGDNSPSKKIIHDALLKAYSKGRADAIDEAGKEILKFVI